MLIRWPHQLQAVTDVLAAIADGYRRIILTSPTGGGKSLIMADLIREFMEWGWRGVLYTNRKMLVEKTSEYLNDQGISHGVRASGHVHDLDQRLQVSSIQTEQKRVLTKGTWELHDAQFVFVDEAHVHNNETADRILGMHFAKGAVIILVTATPLDMELMGDKMIVAGTNSELRKCGALVPCYHYGASEPDIKGILKNKTPSEGKDLTGNQNRKVMMTPGIFGVVLKWYRKLNPSGLPALLFGPGVAESLWLAEQFREAGIEAAHIDGDKVWMYGEWHNSAGTAGTKVRKKLEKGSKDGTIKVVCNRYVLREGIDWPWIEHMILAFVSGSLQTYLQVGGRGLRASPPTGKTRLILQDHGGAWHKHGSLNADRCWELGDTNVALAGVRAADLRDKKKKEPFLCPFCELVLSVRVCPNCGWERPAEFIKSRPVIQESGDFRLMTGDVYKPRRISKRRDAAKVWTTCYYRAKNAGLTFTQAEWLFAKDSYWNWPARGTLPLMPLNPKDWHRKVSDVAEDRLTERKGSNGKGSGNEGTTAKVRDHHDGEETSSSGGTGLFDPGD